MEIENALALGKEDENGAFIIDDSKRDPLVEKALLLFFEGASLKTASELVNIPQSTLLARIGRNCNYVEHYARAKVGKGIGLIEDVLELSSNMTGNETAGELAKIDRQREDAKWACGKYAPHFGKAMESANLTLNVSQGSRIVIEEAVPVDKGDSLRNATDADVVEIESQ